MTSLLSGLGFFASGIGIVTTCAVAAAMVLLWNWRLNLLGLLIVQFGVTAVALSTQRVAQDVMIVQCCVLILCVLILGLSSFQTPKSPTIRQSGNWFLRLLALILLYFALRLAEFDFVLPLPDVGASEALQITIFFAWLCICSLLMLGFSDNPLFTGIALLLWCVPVHLLAAILTPVSGIVVLIGIVELLLALACSYLILTESFSAEPRPIVSTDVTFPVEGQRLLTDASIVPIGEMTTLDIPAVGASARDRAALAGKTLPVTAPSGTVLAQQPPLPGRQRQPERSTQPERQRPPERSAQPERERPPESSAQPERQRLPERSTQPERAATPPRRVDSVPPTGEHPRATPPRRSRTGTPLTRTNLRAVRRPLTPPNQAEHTSIPNQVPDDELTDMEPTQPTPHIFGTRSADLGDNNSGDTDPVDTALVDSDDAERRTENAAEANAAPTQARGQADQKSSRPGSSSESNPESNQVSDGQRLPTWLQRKK